MHYYYAYLLRVVRTSSLRSTARSSPTSLLGLFGSLLSIPNLIPHFSRLLFFFDHHGHKSPRTISLSLVVSHGRRGFPQAHSVRLAHYEEREEETKERIRFAVEAVAVTRSKRRRRRTTTTSTIKTTTRTTRTTTTESLRPIRVA